MSRDIVERGTNYRGQLKKSNPGGGFEAMYQLDSSANPAHLPQKWAKRAKLAVLLSW